MKKCFRFHYFLKSVPSPTQFRLFHRFNSHRFWALIVIVNPYIWLVQRLISHAPRAYRRPTLHSPARFIIYTSVFIGSRSDPWLPRYRPGKASAFSTSCSDFPMRNLWRIGRFLQLVPRAHCAPQRLDFLTIHVAEASPRSCANFTHLLTIV